MPLGMGLGLDKSAGPLRDIHIAYSSDFSAGANSWTVVNDDPAVVPVAPSTVDGVDDCVKITFGTDLAITITRGSVVGTDDDFKNISFSADVYVDSATRTGDLHLFFGGFSQNVTDLSVSDQTWTPVNVNKQLGNVAGASFGFNVLSADGYAQGDVIALKNIQLTIYDD